MSDKPLVELIDVCKTYANDTVALDGFNATLRQGEFVSLLGPSGCGKSTVLRIIAALSQPTSGTVRRAWDVGANAHSCGNSVAQFEQPVGCVFQEPTLLPWASTWQNVYLPLRLRGLSKQSAKPRVDEALELVGLTGFANAYPRELSGGMKMRASIARALVARPRLLLLDEPFAALDEITRARLNEDVLTLWSQQRWTVLFITHSIYESVFLSTRVLVMSPRPGRIVDEIVTNLPMPRTAETRTSPSYLEPCRLASLALVNASATGTTPGQSA